MIRASLFLSFLYVLLLPQLSLAAEREVILGPFQATVTNRVLFITTPTTTEAFSDLKMNFSYDASTLDASPHVDSFSYGFMHDGIAYEIGTVSGLSGTDSREIGVVDQPLPAEMSVGEISLYVSVLANSATSDDVKISNLLLSGIRRGEGVANTEDSAYIPRDGKVRICHFDDETDTFFNESVNMMSIVKGAGHGKHGDDIIPPFWYVGSGEVTQKFPGQDWNAIGRIIYERECLSQ